MQKIKDYIKHIIEKLLGKRCQCDDKKGEK
jgi:hypothetical protein